MEFFKLWARWAGKYTLGQKFGSLPKDGAGLALKKEGQDGILGPSFRLPSQGSDEGSNS